MVLARRQCLTVQLQAWPKQVLVLALICFEHLIISLEDFVSVHTSIHHTHGCPVEVIGVYCVSPAIQVHRESPNLCTVYEPCGLSPAGAAGSADI
jgi:hypothetical protein